jgi:hypothetical protein
MEQLIHVSPDFPKFIRSAIFVRGRYYFPKASERIRTPKRTQRSTSTDNFISYHHAPLLPGFFLGGKEVGAWR